MSHLKFWGFYALCLVNIDSLYSAAPISGVEWKEQGRVISNGHGGVVAKLVYLGTNTNSFSVRIESVVSDCACLKIFTLRDVLPSGGSSKLFVEFGVRDGGGINKHEILINTEEDNIKIRTPLECTVDVPELFNLSHKKLVWGLGEMDTLVSSLSIPLKSAVHFKSATLVATDPSSFIVQTNIVSSHSNTVYSFMIKPGYPSSLTPKKVGSLAYLGIKLEKEGKELRDLVELVNWPVRQP